MDLIPYTDKNKERMKIVSVSDKLIYIHVLTCMCYYSVNIVCFFTVKLFQSVFENME